jgi:hypothetical protein
MASDEEPLGHIYFTNYRETVVSNTYCRALPFFSCFNTVMMEAIWVNNMACYGMKEIQKLPKLIRLYFRNIKYGRHYCKRLYILMRKPFHIEEKETRMDLTLCCLISLLDNGLAELIHEKKCVRDDTFNISLCFNHNTFIIYTYIVKTPVCFLFWLYRSRDYCLWREPF